MVAARACQIEVGRARQRYTELLLLKFELEEARELGTTVMRVGTSNGYCLVTIRALGMIWA
ncbi:hypothetical protein [Sphingomonas sp. LR55]|uniref:hypothetical protein n=1 Tax=Sphingomonas sp. LR55 TaxID=3050231 RepID=UPI002FE278C6